MRHEAKRKASTALLCAGLAFLPLPAQAQQPHCGLKSELTKAAQDLYGEHLLLRMVGADGMTREIWTSDEGKTYTVFAELRADVFCVLDVGIDLKMPGKLGRES